MILSLMFAEEQVNSVSVDIITCQTCNSENSAGKEPVRTSPRDEQLERIEAMSVTSSVLSFSTVYQGYYVLS